MWCSSLPDVDVFLPVTEHRRETHTIWFAGVVGVLLFVLFTVIPFVSAVYASIAGLLGIVLHLIGDIPVKHAGVSPLLPFGDEYVVNVFRGDNRRVNNAFALSGVGAIFIVLLSVL